jgi:hypothetical protein
MTRARKTAKTGATASRQPNLPIAVIVWRGDDPPTRMGFDDPLEALLTAITYLRRKHSVRLTNVACDELDAMSPELEKLLTSSGGKPGAAQRELAKRRPASEAAADLGKVPVGQRLRAPAARFAAPGAVPVALD